MARQTNDNHTGGNGTYKGTSRFGNPISTKEAEKRYNDEMILEGKQFSVNNPVLYEHKVFSTASFAQPLSEGTIINVNPITMVERSDRKGKYYFTDIGFPKRLDIEAQFSSIDEAACELLTALVKIVQPKVAIETGTHKGRSTRSIVEGLAQIKRGHLYTLDRSDHNIKESGAILPNQSDYVTTVFGDSPSALNNEPFKSLTGIEFAFLDSTHTLEGVLAEIEWLESHIAEECLVLVDNANDDGWPGLKELFKNWTKYPNVSINTMCGIQIINLRKKNA